MNEALIKEMKDFIRKEFPNNKDFFELEHN